MHMNWMQISQWIIQSYLLIPCIASYRVSLILCRLWHNWHLSGIPHLTCVRWITYNLPIDIIGAHTSSWAILIPFWVPQVGFPICMCYLIKQRICLKTANWSEAIYVTSCYMCLLAANVKACSPKYN